MNRTLDVAGYYRLPRPVRDKVDEWFEAEGIDKKWVFEVTLTCEGIVTVGRYRAHPDKGCRFFDHHLGKPAQQQILVAVRTPPPREAFECSA